MSSQQKRSQNFSSLEIQPRKADRLYYWLKSNKVYLRYLFSFIAFIATLGATIFAFYSLDKDSYLQELNSAIIGALMTAPLSLAVTLVAFWERLHAERERKRISRHTKKTQRKHAIQVGRMQIPDISIIASASHRTAWDSNIEIEWLWGEKRKLPAEIESLQEVHLPNIQESALENGLKLEDGPCVDLLALTEIIDSETKKRRYTLKVAKMSYLTFASTANILGWEYLEGRTIREHFDIHVDNYTSLEELPVNAMLGCGTVVITNDNRLLIGVRRNTFIAGMKDPNSAHNATRTLPVHFIAEGIIPSDIDEAYVPTHLTNLRNPAADTASLRAQEEELAVGSGGTHIAGISELYGTGFFIDHVRMQPCFSYLSKLNRSANEVLTRTSEAKDHWEMETVLDWEFSPDNDDIIDLLLNRHPYYHLASNHAAAYLWFALVFEFGFDTMSEKLHRTVR